MIKIIAFTDIGQVRQKNQDGFYVDGISSVNEANRTVYFETSSSNLLAYVADGVGSTMDAEYAVDRLIKYSINHDKQLTFSSISQFVDNANGFINQSAAAEKKSCATTIAAVLIIGDRLYSFNVGDSKVFVLNNTFLEQISTDDTAITLIRESDIDDTDLNMEAKVPILQYLGGNKVVHLDPHVQSVDKRDVLICTDGLTDMVSIDDMEDIISNANGNCEAIIQGLYDEAMKNGGTDNITIIYIHFC